MNANVARAFLIGILAAVFVFLCASLLFTGLFVFGSLLSAWDTTGTYIWGWAAAIRVILALSGLSAAIAFLLAFVIEMDNNTK